MPGAIVERGTKARDLRRSAPSLYARPAQFDPAARAASGRGGCRSIPGSPPSLLDLPPGCAFAPRCPTRFEPCASTPGARWAAHTPPPASSRAAPMTADPLLESCIELSKHFTVGSRFSRARPADRACRRRRLARRSGRARRSAWSANRVAESRRSGAAWCGSTTSPRASCCFDGEDISTASRCARCGRCAGACRWSSRIPTPRSIRGGGCAT